MILEKIKADQLAARKGKDSVTASLLTTMIGEAEMAGKNAGNRSPTDDEVVALLKKFEKGANETIRFLQAAGTDNQDKIAMMQNELTIIRRFLPAKLADLQVEKDIAMIMTNNLLPKESKSIGVVGKELRSKYGSQFDGAQVAAIFKRVIT